MLLNVLALFSMCVYSPASRLPLGWLGRRTDAGVPWWRKMVWWWTLVGQCKKAEFDVEFDVEEFDLADLYIPTLPLGTSS